MSAPLFLSIEVTETPILPIYIRINSPNVTVYGENVHGHSEYVIAYETIAEPEKISLENPVPVRIRQKCHDSYPMITPWGVRAMCDKEIEFDLYLRTIKPRPGYEIVYDNPLDYRNVIAILNPPGEFTMKLGKSRGQLKFDKFSLSFDREISYIDAKPLIVSKLAGWKNFIREFEKAINDIPTLYVVSFL